MLIDQPIDEPNQPNGLMNMMTTTEIAAEFDTTPRTLRKFLRSDESGIAPVGKGSRYALPSTKRDLNSLRKRFTSWSEALEAKKGSNDAPDADAPADAPETD